LRAIDDAGNETIFTNSNTFSFDTVAPTPSDITFFPLSDSYIVATDSQNIQVNVNPNSGSPITSIKARMELYSNPASYTSVTSVTTGNFSSNYNLSNVDSQRVANNYRPYTFQITEICDQAGNCMAGVPYNTFFNVYADNVNLAQSSITIPS